MRYSMIAAALVGAAAASPAWAPAAGYGQASASTVDQTTVVTVTSCGPEVTDCPGNTPTGYATTTSAQTIPPPAVATPATPAPPAESPFSPVGGDAPPAEYAPPAAGTSSAPAAPPAETPDVPYSPVGGEAPPPAYGASSSSASPSAPVSATPSAGPYSPVGGEAPPPTYPMPSGGPSYPVPGNGTAAPSGTASGAPSASQGYPVQQTGNTAAGIKAGSFLAGCGAIAALLL